MNVTEGRVWAEVYLDHLVNNYHLIKDSARKAQIMAAIKADAYGHGAVEVARTLEAEGITMFGVASVEEGVELRQAGIVSKILVLSPVLYSQIDALLEFGLMPTISELGFYRLLNNKLKTSQRQMLVHVEVDTGMSRTGLDYEKAGDSIIKMNKSPYLEIQGVYSHFPLADSDGAFTNQQISGFKNLIKKLKKNRIKPRYTHLANSSGLFRHQRAHCKLVRPGIALYGLTASPDISYVDGLLPVMALKSRVVNLRTVKKNTSISYGHTYTTKKKSRIATVSVGYGDGYPRMLSDTGEVLIHGQRAPIIGTICMDLLMIDITSIKNVKVGDVVTLIGRDGDEEITAEECALKAHTIVYEITCGIGPRVARVYKRRKQCISVRNLLGRWRYTG